jgi:type IV pilus assembly protein PilE
MRRLRAPHRTMAGVTLIELLVVTVIIAILAAIAVPAYQSHVIKTNRSAAKACLSEYAQFMERYYTTNLTYAGATGTPACKDDANLKQRYAFATSNLAQGTYTLTASPVGAQRRDTQCGVLKIIQDGSKTASGSGGTTFCW